MPEETLKSMLPALRERAKVLRAKLDSMAETKRELETIEAMLYAADLSSAPCKAP